MCLTELLNLPNGSWSAPRCSPEVLRVFEERPDINAAPLCCRCNSNVIALIENRMEALPFSARRLSALSRPGLPQRCFLQRTGWGLRLLAYWALKQLLHGGDRMTK